MGFREPPRNSFEVPIVAASWRAPISNISISGQRDQVACTLSTHVGFDNLLVFTQLCRTSFNGNAANL